MPAAPRVGVPAADGSGPDDGCQHAAEEYAPLCQGTVDYHLVSEDGQPYGWGIVSMHTCSRHLVDAVLAGVLISAHLAGPQCWEADTVAGMVELGCVPSHVLNPDAQARIINPKDGS